MLHATFTRPDLTTFTRLDELGLEVVGQHVEARRAVLGCRVVAPDDWCRRCGCQGVPRDDSPHAEQNSGAAVTTDWMART